MVPLCGVPKETSPFPPTRPPTAVQPLTLPVAYEFVMVRCCSRPGHRRRRLTPR